jgi:hypothetical protein
MDAVKVPKPRSTTEHTLECVSKVEWPSIHLLTKAHARRLSDTLTLAQMLKIWRAVGRVIATTLISGKGLHLEGLGTLHDVVFSRGVLVVPLDRARATSYTSRECERTQCGHRYVDRADDRAAQGRFTSTLMATRSSRSTRCVRACDTTTPRPRMQARRAPPPSPRVSHSWRRPVCPHEALYRSPLRGVASPPIYIKHTDGRAASITADDDMETPRDGPTTRTRSMAMISTDGRGQRDPLAGPPTDAPWRVHGLAQRAAQGIQL